MCCSRNRYQPTYNYHHRQRSTPPIQNQQHSALPSAPENSVAKNYTRTSSCARPDRQHPTTPAPYPTTCRPHSPMAALIIGAIAIGSHKIKQKREERKKQRAIDEWGAEQVAMRSAQRQAQEQERAASQPRRKSEEALERRRGSVDGEREGGEAPPPAYEEVVAQARLGPGEERASRAYTGAGGASMMHVAPLGPAGR